MKHAKVLHYFQNKNCVITGASSGIGESLSLQLASLGANIVLIARKKDSLLDIQKQCTLQSSSHTTTIYIYAADLSDPDSAKKAVQYARECMGTIDIAVLCVGATMHDKVDNCTHVVFEKMFNANFYAAAHLIIPMLDALRESNGILACLTSIQSRIGVPFHGAYVAAKHALSGFLETVELENESLKIVEIIPGWVSGTRIREEAIDGKGNKIPSRAAHKRHKRSSTTKEECVARILDGIYFQRRFVFLPHFWRHILFVKYCMRNFLKKLIVTREQYSSSQ